MSDTELFAKLIAEAEKNIEGYIDFEGQNCEEPCEGWDGDHRCQCGNRRVTWVLSDDKTYVYAEAY